MTANNLEAMTRHFAERWSKVTADKELEQYLSDGIAQLENEHRKQVEALQAENEALRAKTSLSIGVGDGTGNLFVHGDYDSIKQVQEMIFECEKLRRDVAMLMGLLDNCVDSMRDAFPDYDHYETDAFISATAVLADYHKGEPDNEN